MHNGLFLRNVVVFHNIFTFYIIINKFHAHDFSLTEYIKYDQRIYHACVKFLLRGPCKASKNNLRGIDRFHLTSRRPYWCTKTMKWRPCILVYGTGISSFLFKYFVLFHHPTGATDHVSENDLYQNKSHAYNSSSSFWRTKKQLYRSSEQLSADSQDFEESIESFLIQDCMWSLQCKFSTFGVYA
jgi:hypothetical protein